MTQFQDGDTLEDITVAVNIASHDMMHATTAGDLARMMIYTGAHFVPNNGLKAVLINQVNGTLISSARNDLTAGALEQGVDYMLWVDADMRFPRDALVRLLSHSKAIVGVNYSNRKVKKTDYVAVKRLATGLDDEGIGELLQTTAESEGLEEVEGIGFGMVLTHASVFDAIPQSLEVGPWFQFGWDSDVGRPIGEDIWFSKAARKAGFKIYVDHDLSKEIKHSANMELSVSHVEDRYTYVREMQDAAGN